jgi:hypothetical protein
MFPIADIVSCQVLRKLQFGAMCIWFDRGLFGPLTSRFALANLS